MYRIDILNFCESGNVTEVVKYLESNTLDKSTFSRAISKCIDSKDFSNDHLEIIRKLIENGADVTMRVTNSQTILQQACQKGLTEVVKLLLIHGSAIDEKDTFGRTTVITALMNKKNDPINLIKILIEKGVNPLSEDLKKTNALHCAAQNGHKDSVEYLLKLGVNPNAKNIDGLTPYQLARMNNKQICIDLLSPVSLFKDLPEGNGKPQKKYQKDDWQKKNKKSKSSTKKFEGLCLKCRQVAEVLCRECNKSEKESIIKEQEECIRHLETKIKLLEKENNEFKETLGTKSGGYKVKSRLSPLFFRKVKEKTQDTIINCLQNDILSFIRDQERFLANVDEKFKEGISIFKGLIEENFKGAQVELYGSFSTGLLLPYSDIDLIITNSAGQPGEVLKDLSLKIEELSIVKSIEKIFTASIPVLKLNINLKGEDIKIDITVQESKHKGIECKNLVKKFLGTYRTIKQVYLVLKQLIYFSNFHEPFKGGLSSYGLFLMVVYFYQVCGSNWNFNLIDKDNNCAMILCQFLAFYIQSFDFSQPILVEYEGFNSREYQSKMGYKSINIPDPLNPKNNVAHNAILDRLDEIFRTAYSFVYRNSLCECQDCSNYVIKILYETRFNMMTYGSYS